MNDPADPSTDLALPEPAPEAPPDMSFEALEKKRDELARELEARVKAGDPLALSPGAPAPRRDSKGLVSPGNWAFEAEPAIRRACALNGVDFVRPTATVFFCAGDCGAGVPRHGGYCDPCRGKEAKNHRDSFLAEAWASVDPEGSRSWCRASNETFQKVMRRPAAACSLCPPGRPDPKCASCSGSGMRPPGIQVLFEKMPQADQTDEAKAIIRAIWGRPLGGLVLLGPTEAGKSALLSAIAIRILDKAAAGELDAEGFKFACGIRATTGFDLADARRKNRLGTEEDPPEIAMAKRCTLLILDEAGFEDLSFDPLAVQGVLKYRYSRNKPVLLGGGRTFAGMCERYGEANIRTVYQPGGRLIDLWQGVH